MEPKQSDALDRVMDLVRFLRTHCPWDAAQTPRSLIPYLLEEAHETADAIAEGDDAGLRSELGDLLLNLAFQVVLAQERDAFDADDVARTIIDKMQRRHPHLYGLGEKEDWETMKARERAEHAPDAGILQGIARGLDPLSRAHRIQDRVAAVGFDWADASGAYEKVVEELEEVREELLNGTTAEQQETTTAQQHKTTTAEQHNSTTAQRHHATAPDRHDAPGAAGSALEEELGDLLFAVVNLSRLAGVHPLTALQRANAKFAARFEALERLAGERGIVLEEAGLEALDRLWDEIKAGEKPGEDG